MQTEGLAQLVEDSQAEVTVRYEARLDVAHATTCTCGGITAFESRMLTLRWLSEYRVKPGPRAVLRDEQQSQKRDELLVSCEEYLEAD